MRDVKIRLLQSNDVRNFMLQYTRPVERLLRPLGRGHGDDFSRAGAHRANPGQTDRACTEPAVRRLPPALVEDLDLDSTLRPKPKPIGKLGINLLEISHGAPAKNPIQLAIHL